MSFGTSSGANPRLNDLASQSFIESSLHRNFLCTPSVLPDRSHIVITTNANHAGRFIEERRNPYYTGYRPRYAAEQHFDLGDSIL